MRSIIILVAQLVSPLVACRQHLPRLTLKATQA